DERLRVLAAEALGTIGASAAAPALSVSVVGPKGLDPVPAVRRAALAALVRVNASAPQTVEVLRQAVHDRAGDVSSLAGELIAAHATAAQVLLPGALADPPLAAVYLERNLAAKLGPDIP